MGSGTPKACVMVRSLSLVSQTLLHPLLLRLLDRKPLGPRMLIMSGMGVFGSVLVHASFTQPPSVLNYLAGVAPDNTFLSKPCLTCAWNTLTNPTKATDLVQMPDNSLIVLGLDKTLYTCATLTVWDTCKNVPNSGAALSIDLLGDGTTLIGVGTDNQLYTRAGLSGAWVLVPGSGTVVDVTVLANGALLGTAPDGTLYKKTTLTSAWTLLNKVGDISTLVGVGSDNRLYTRNGLISDAWTLVPNSGYVVDITFLEGGILLGTGVDGKLLTKQSLTAPWVTVANSCCVYHTVQFYDGSILGVGTDNAIYQRKTVSDPWVLLPNTQTVTSVAWAYLK
ncbi:hypothetical protein HDU79_007507 [Rhizoclosmatium sp. JEL0117]|nr:hypothetical protein HDU79_007507 [Rhizoclosmatium sp. JEL0117]